MFREHVDDDAEQECKDDEGGVKGPTPFLVAVREKACKDGTEDETQS